MTTTNTNPAMDQCKRCTVRGDMDGCRATPCNVRTSWFTQETEATHLRELAAYRLTVENLEREIAAQQPAQSSAAADTVVLEAALRAIHQAIDLIGEPDTERLRTVRRVLRGAVVVAEDCKAPQADSQPAPDEIINMAREQGLPETETEGVFIVNVDDLGRMFASYRAARATAGSVQEDAARLDWLDQQCEGYGFQDIHEGNRWEISGPYANVRQAIDAARAAQNEGKP